MYNLHFYNQILLLLQLLLLLLLLRTAITFILLSFLFYQPIFLEQSMWGRDIGSSSGYRWYKFL